MASNSTRISLNDRFTIMQTVGGGGGGPNGGHPNAASIMRRPRSRSRSRSRSVGRTMAPMVTSPMRPAPRAMAMSPAPRSRLARHYEDVMVAQQQQQQFMNARTPAIRNIRSKQRLALAMANRGPSYMAGLRSVARPQRRANGARAALATLRMDQVAAAARARVRGGGIGVAAALRQRRLNRAIATVNQAQLRRMAAAPVAGNGRLSRRDLARSMSKSNLVRSRSRSRSKGNLAAVAPAQLRRSNSRLNLVQGGGAQGQGQPRRRINRDFQQRARSRSRGKTPSIASRLGVRPGTNAKNAQGVRGRSQSRQRSTSIAARLGTKKGPLNRVAQGRVSKQQRLGGGGPQQQQQQGQRGRRSQSVTRNVRNKNQVFRGKGKPGQVNVKGAAGKQGRNAQRKPSALQQRLQKGGQKQQQQQGQGKTRRGKRGTGAKRAPLKKEDLDKELDKYMSTSN